MSCERGENWEEKRGGEEREGKGRGEREGVKGDIETEYPRLHESLQSLSIPFLHWRHCYLSHTWKHPTLIYYYQNNNKLLLIIINTHCLSSFEHGLPHQVSRHPWLLHIFVLQRIIIILVNNNLNLKWYHCFIPTCLERIEKSLISTSVSELMIGVKSWSIDINT